MAPSFPRRLVLADVGDLRLGEAHEVGRLDAKRLLVRARLDHERIQLGEASVDENRVAAGPSERRHRSQLELRVITRQILLAGEVDVLTTAEEIAHLAQVKSLRGRQQGAQVTRE